MKKLDLEKAAKTKWPESKAMVGAIFCAINEAMLRKETVTILHFGRFEVVQTKWRTAWDFKLNKRVPITPKLKIKFTPSPRVEKMVNERNVVL